MPSQVVKIIAYVITTLLVFFVFGFLIFLIYRSTQVGKVDKAPPLLSFIDNFKQKSVVCAKKEDHKDCQFIGLDGLVKAFSEAKEGVSIEIRSGYYAGENLILSSKDKPLKTVVIAGSGPDTVLEISSKLADFLTLDFAENVRIEKLVIRTPIGKNAIRISNSKKITIAEIQLVQGGLLLRNSQDVSINKNLIENASISVHDDSKAIISDNAIYGGKIERAYNGILVVKAQADVINNTIYSSYHGVLCKSPSKCKIINNIFLENENAIKIDQSELAYNIFWKNTNQPGKNLLAGTNKEIDPLLVNPAQGDFRLQDKSPAKDAGSNDAQDEDGSPADIGSRYHPKTDSAPETSLAPEASQAVSPIPTIEAQRITPVSPAPTANLSSNLSPTKKIQPSIKPQLKVIKGQDSCLSLFALSPNKFSPDCRPCRCDGRRQSQFNCRECPSDYSFCYGGYCMSAE